MSVLDRFEQNTKNYQILGVIVHRDGAVLDRLHREAEMRLDQYSVSKSFLSTAIGIAVGEGKITLDDRVCDVLSDKLPAEPSEYLLQLKLSDLLKMSMGQAEVGMMGNERSLLRERDWAAYCLRKPIVHKPGTRFLYTNTTAYLAALMLQRKTGEYLIEYLMPRLFDPLDIPRPTWEKDPEAYDFGASGLFLTLSDMSKIGLLYLQGGNWEGKQLVPAEWANTAVSAQIVTGMEYKEQREYCYGFWRCTNNAYRADGMLGQYSIVYPEKNAVVSINSRDYHQMEILGCVMDWIYPEL